MSAISSCLSSYFEIYQRKGNWQRFSSPKGMQHGTARVSSNLELQAPQLRPEAFPWGSANVEIHAVFTSRAYRRIVSLPGVVDLSALLAPGGDADDHLKPAESLGVEVLGYDNGVTFPLGNASIPLPPTLQPTTLSDRQFRLCLLGEEGVRNGTLVGQFQARSCNSGGLGPGCAVVEFQQNITGEATGVREAKKGMASEQASKVNLLWRSVSRCVLFAPYVHNYHADRIE